MIGKLGRGQTKPEIKDKIDKLNKLIDDMGGITKKKTREVEDSSDPNDRKRK